MKQGIANESEARSAGILPNSQNTSEDERSLPDFARQARQLIRAGKMQKEIEARRT